ncbi:MAG: condensation domain-containing protein, partial [Bacteroidota bacterium]|nr:condensation domain-containing protein [Bacteroidota bacterium]
QVKIDSSRNREYVCATNSLEEELIAIWSELLSVDKISITDNFFELGGHSLLAIQLITRINRKLKCQVPLRNIFDFPILKDFAEEMKVYVGNEKLTPIIQKVNRDGNIPLSLAQERLWVLDQLEPGKALYNIPSAYRISGNLNIEYLEKSINYVIKRHEVLRTKIITSDGNATQKILPEKSCTIRKINLPEDLNDPDRIKNIILEIILKDAKTSFNISEDLFRIHIIKVKENDHVVLLNMHHIISDGWSSVIFIREIAEIYSSFEKQKEAVLPPLNLQYADYSIWQRELLKNEKYYTELIHYWKEKLENINTTTLESDFTRPEIQSFNGKHIVTRLKPAITSKLEELAGKNNVTPFMFLLSAFNLLLYKYTGQTDIIVGTPVANRDHPDIENLIGFFVNTIVLRTQFSESDSFTHLLDKVRETTLGAYSHQQMPFNKLVEEINPERNTSHTPLFQIMFMMQNIPQKKVEPIKGLTIETLEVENELSTFDLSIIIEKDSDGFVIAAEFNKDLYKESTISGFLSQYAYLLDQLSFNSMKTLKEYSLIKEEEKRKILNELSNVEIVNGTIISEIERGGCEVSRNIAIKEKGKEISYRELEERTNKLSRYIIGKL